jgi:hypothetical protein
MPPADRLRTVTAPLPDGLGPDPLRPRAITLGLTREWHPLQQPDGASPLPPQLWRAAVTAVLGTDDDEATERAELVARKVRESGAHGAGDVVLRAFAVDDLSAIGLTVSVLRRRDRPSWADPDGAGPSIDDEARRASAEATMLSASGLPPFLRLARDDRTGDVSPRLLIALAGHDAARDEGFDAGEAVGEDATPVSDDEDTTSDVWLRYLVPMEHCDAVLSLTFTGHAEYGMEWVMLLAHSVVEELRFVDAYGALTGHTTDDRGCLFTMGGLFGGIVAGVLLFVLTLSSVARLVQSIADPAHRSVGAIIGYAAAATVLAVLDVLFLRAARR